MAHFEFGVTLEVVEQARSDYFMSMGGASFYGGVQTDAEGRGNIALFSVWTSGGSGEITFVNTDWGFDGRYSVSSTHPHPHHNPLSLV